MAEMGAELLARGLPHRIVLLVSALGRYAGPVATEDWALAGAPIYRLPDVKRVRLAEHVNGAKTYSRADGVDVVMPADHFIVWSSWHRGPDGAMVGEGLPAYIPRETWDLTYANERPAADGFILADKTNMIRAAVYSGRHSTRILVNENDPTRPESWANLNPGDHVALAVDNAGNPMTYRAADGVLRNDQYPIHGSNWEHLGWEPVAPLPPGVTSSIDSPNGPVLIVRSTSVPQVVGGLGQEIA